MKCVLAFSIWKVDTIFGPYHNAFVRYDTFCAILALLHRNIYVPFGAWDECEARKGKTGRFSQPTHCISDEGNRPQYQQPV